MDRTEIRLAHRQQARIFTQLRCLVKRGRFVCRHSGHRSMLNQKLNFLSRLKRDLKVAFRFDDYQAEFVKNEAISRVLRHQPERLLIMPDTKKAEKLVHTSFILGRHYFRFIATML